MVKLDHRRVELLRQSDSQIHPHERCLTVDHHAGDLFGTQQGRSATCAPQGVPTTGSTPVGEHHHQSAPVRVTSTLACHQVTRGQQTLRQGSLAAGIEPLQPAA